MKVIALIPARYEATRFPGKLMKMLGTKTVVRHTYENTVATLLFDEVIVVTDSEIIFKEIIENGGYAIKSEGNFESGTQRIASIAKDIDAEIFVNVQGDEPFVKREMLEQLVQIFQYDVQQKISVASLMHPITEKEDKENVNYVKVVTDLNHNALYFSRSVIPFQREKNDRQVFYKHIGIYAFRKDTLLQFAQLKPGILEKTENLEQLRYLENGIKIKMVVADAAPLSIDVPTDLLRANTYLDKEESK
ncbi:MAG: 3-deoxy-manno-octulosonate cytidylyltransferase [Bacteroidetes bacterium]|nr:3-deoxy-manno-octulosonate cytidylyltransferase [Bacteroidota bacterium]